MMGGKNPRTGRLAGRRWRFGIVAVFTVVFFLSACGAPQPAKPGEGASSAPGDTASGGAPGSSGEGTSITVAANGGKIERAIRDMIAPRFKEQTGIDINFIAGLSGEILSKVELQKDAPTIDVAFYVPLDVKRAADKGLAEPIDEKLIPHLKNVDDRFVAIDGVGAPVFGLTIAPLYNTEFFKKKGLQPPKSWNDLISPAYEGKTAIADIANDWGFTVLYNLALANGGTLDDLTPGLEKAKELARYSNTFYKNSTLMMPAFQQGEAVIGVMGSYATGDLAKGGLPVKLVIPEEGTPLQAFSATIVKGTPKKEAAAKFIDFVLTEEAQALFAKEGFYPVLQGMSVDPSYADVIGFTPEEAKRLYRPDVPKLAAIRAQWVDRWNQEVKPELGKGVK